MYLLQFLILHNKTNNDVHFHEPNVLKHDHRQQIDENLDEKKSSKDWPINFILLSEKTQNSSSSRVITMISDFHPSPQGFFTLSGLLCTLTITKSSRPLAPSAGWLQILFISLRNLYSHMASFTLCLFFGTYCA